jgi:hypothetical protein
LTDHAIDLLALPLAARRDLLKVLTSDSAVRADVVRQFLDRGMEGMVDLLAELEADAGLRRDVVAALERVI